MESFFSRISGALKRGGNNDEKSTATAITQLASEDESQQDVVNTVVNAHPNMSLFNSVDNSVETPIPHYATMKRGSKLPATNTEENVSSSNNKRSLRISKKLLYPLNLGHGGSDISAIAIRPAGGEQGVPSTSAPSTAIESRFSSLRSALRSRDSNKDKGTVSTPTSNRSVRFFSRDATRPTSPTEATIPNYIEGDQTTYESMLGDDDNSALATSSPTITRQRRSVRDVFQGDVDVSTPSPLVDRTSGISFSPVPPPELSNIFNMSAEREPPAIPLSDGLDNSAAETDDAQDIPGDEATVQRRAVRNQSFPTVIPPDTQLPASPRSATHDRTQSFSFGQTVFFSAARSASGGSDPNASSASNSNSPVETSKPLNRSRAQSETIFKLADNSPTSPQESGSASALPGRVSQYLSGLLPSRAPSRSSTRSVLEPGARPSVDGLGVDARDNVQSHIRGSPHLDPFAADARTYFGPETQIPQTPPDTTRDVYFPLPDVGALDTSRTGAQSRASSREDAHASTIANLQAQIALQDEMKRQFELDLSARDELVVALRNKLSTANSDAEVRKAAMRGWKKKVQELERACRYLEEEVDRSTRSEVERSVLEEASAGALKMLHERISVLEKEKAEAESSYETLHDDMERQKRSRNAFEDLNDQADDLGLEERKTLESKLQMLEVELTQARKDSVAFRSEAEDRAAHLQARNEELQLLRDELEVQWRGTELSSEKLNQLKRERDQAHARCAELEKQVRQLEENARSLQRRYEEAEMGKAELQATEKEAWAAKEAAEHERDELELQIRDGQHQDANELLIALQEREDRITELQDEATYTHSTIVRLERNVRERDSEAAEYVQRLRASEDAAEDLRQQLSKSAREHRRMAEDHRRELEEIRQNGGVAQTELEELIRVKAEADVRQTQLHERTTSLEVELDKLRRQVHEMQQESAKKDLHITQLNKQRAQDKEDIQGLNIALDSKQQELELVRRRQEKQSSRTSTVTVKPSTHRRVSSSTARPGVKPSLGSRPSSVMSVSSTRESDVESVTAIRPLALAPKRIVSATSTIESDTESVDVMRPPRVTRISRSASSTQNESEKITAIRVSTLTKGTRANSLASSTASATSSNVTATAKPAHRASIAGSTSPLPASASILRPRPVSSSSPTSASQSVSTRLLAVRAVPTSAPSARRASLVLSTGSGVESDGEDGSSNSEKENAPTPRARRPVPST